MNKKLSVIVPVYNAASYLKRCIDSLLNQTMPISELIVVNDGSTDNSRSIIEDYQTNNPQIIVINQDNQGVSAARNKGLSVATGEYVGFVDADDDIEPDMYETLYSAAISGDCDVVISNFESELDGHRLITKYPFPVDVVLFKDEINKIVLPFFLKSDELNTACSKIYRKSLIETNGIAFPANVTLGEDGIFNMLFFSSIQKMKYIDYTGYHYRDIAGSATRSVATKDYFGRALEVYESILPDGYAALLDPKKVEELKSIKLVQNVIAYIHIYLNPDSGLSLVRKISYVRSMLSHRLVKESISFYNKEKAAELGAYQKAMLFMISRKSLCGLYALTTYSRFRNKK